MRATARAFLSGLLGLYLSACGDDVGSGDRPSSRIADDEVSAIAAQISRDVPRPSRPRNPSAIFISGHSLVDRPFPEHLATVAASLGSPVEWNRQYIVGSGIIARTRGTNAAEGVWLGYRTGENRIGAGMDVLAELRDPTTISVPAYDVLLITEQHWLLSSLVFADTVRYLRHYHDRFIEANPSGRTYFFESWLAVDDKSDPRRWIDYERAASRAWRCIVTRVNTSLAHLGREDRIISLPAGLALADLISAATTGSGIPGVTRATVRQTVELLIEDDVHPTEVGRYFVALVTYAAIFGRDPLGAAAPTGIEHGLAESLQRFAWRFVSEHYDHEATTDIAECRREVVSDFAKTYGAYFRDTYYVPEVGRLRAWVRWLRRRMEWAWILSRKDHRNPLYFDPQTDSSYWFPPPDLAAR